MTSREEGSMQAILFVWGRRWGGSPSIYLATLKLDLRAEIGLLEFLLYLNSNFWSAYLIHLLGSGKNRALMHYNSTFRENLKDRPQPYPLWDSKTKFFSIFNCNCTWYNLNHFLVPVEISPISNPSFPESLGGNINTRDGPGLFQTEENRQRVIMTNI